MSLPFDKVVVVTESGERELEPDQFLALPLHQRVRHMLQARLRFLQDDEPVDKREAIQALMALARAS